MSRNTPILFVVAATLLVVVAGCKSESPTGSTCPTSSTLTYESFGKAFMRKYCADCHSGSTAEHPSLDSVTAIRSNASAIDRTTASGPNASNDSMPEGTSVSDAERKQLGEWLACGAP